jgi:hypothetical protein
MKIEEVRNCSERLTMTRAEFLRTLGTGATAIAGSLIGVGSFTASAAASKATKAEVEVYPTGIFPVDVEEVTAAVNGTIGPSGRSYPGGGVVRLKATSASGAPTFFNFGGAYPSLNRGTVRVIKDVTILGELMSPTAMTFPYDPTPEPGYIPDRTVVYGGKRAFACPYFAPAPTKLTVRNVFFAYPSLAAVQVTKTAGLEVSDCVLYDVKPDDTGIGFSAATSIEASGVVTAPNQELFGDFRVMNNRIRRASPVAIPPIPPGVETGIVMNLAAMDAQIMANEIDRFAFVGVGIDRNNGTVTVAGNTITNCGYGGLPGSGGIGVRGTTTPVFVERNSVTGGYAGPSMSLPSKNGITLASSNTVVRSNTFDGAFALQGILLTSFTATGTTWYATDNRIEKNDLSESTAMRAQVLLQAGCDRNRFANNDYGSVGSGAAAGMVVQSAENAFINENFWGTYSGIGGQPCVLLAQTSRGNAVSAFKYQGAPQGFDVCDQVLDQGTNLVHGYEKCK